jgi:putative hydrolases of HD superfamily
MNNNDLINFYKSISRLKRLKRSGWVLNNIDNPETVAEHSFALALLGMIMASKLNLDIEKVVKMSLIHDLGESVIGDIIVSDGVKILNDPVQKVKNERKALASILKPIDVENYIDLFDEYEDQITKEAKLVKQLDRLEMALQALEYEHNSELDLESFFINTRAALIDEDLKILLEEIELLRKKT